MSIRRPVAAAEPGTDFRRLKGTNARRRRGDARPQYLPLPLPLLWRVVAINASVLVAACLVTIVVFSPRKLGSVAPEEAVVLPGPTSSLDRDALTRTHRIDIALDSGQPLERQQGASQQDEVAGCERNQRHDHTVAQGDTREVGLDRLEHAGWPVHRAISSEPWPGGASLDMATVWARHDGWRGETVLDRVVVGGISPGQVTRSRVTGNANRLRASQHQSFQGSAVVGMGFVLSPDEAERMIETNGRNGDVLRPYLVGEDLNSRPAGSPSRWVIDFRDWPQERAREYGEPFARVERLVRPERAKSNRARYRDRWWGFAEPVPG